MKYEEIKVYKPGPRLYRHTAQIYQDVLYVYGGRKQDEGASRQDKLWKFDLSKFWLFSRIVQAKDRKIFMEFM